MQWSEFHFLRPWWLLCLLGLLFIIKRHKNGRLSTPWSKVISPHLLPYLTRDKSNKQYFPWLTLLLITLVVVALSGPTFKKIPLATTLGKPPLILALQLNKTMLMSDIEPYRLKRAIFKMTDLFKAYEGAEFALIVYAGDAHVVAPFTEDISTIQNLAQSLSPEIMPKAGNNPLSAVVLANDMMRQKNAKIIFMAADLPDLDALKKQSLSPIYWWVFASNFQPSNLGIDLIPFTADTSDISWIISSLDKDIGKDYVNSSFYDSWFDLGPYVVLIALLLFLLVCFVPESSWLILALFLKPQEADAKLLDLFIRKDQQAQQALEKKDFLKAADLFLDSMRKGLSYYEASRYEDAIKYLSDNKSADGFYNLGNTYVKNKQYQEAINAYNEALKLDPNHQDAKANKDLVEEFLRKEQPENQDKEKEQEENNNNKNEQKNNQEKEEQNNKEEKQEDKKTNENEKPLDKNRNEQKDQSKDKEEDKNLQKDEQTHTPKEAQENKAKEQRLDQETKHRLQQVEPSASENQSYLRRKFYYESSKNQGGK